MVLGSHKGRHFLKGNRVHWLEKKSIQSIQPDELNALFSPFFTFLCAIFSAPFSLSLAPTICPWVSEHCDANAEAIRSNPVKVQNFFSG